MSERSQILVSYVVSLYFTRSLDPLLAMLERYAAMSVELRRRIEFVLVDDASPLPVALPAGLPLNYQLLRIDDDIPWNISGARNLGATVACGQRLILTDADHSFPESTLDYICRARLRHRLYTLRRTHEGKKVSSHPNTFVCKRGVFFDLNGYDEAFTGHYGYEDTFLKALAERAGMGPRRLTRRHGIELRDNKGLEDGDHDLARDLSHNLHIYQRKLALLNAGGDPFRAHDRRFLEFAWHRVEQRYGVD